MIELWRQSITSLQLVFTSFQSTTIFFIFFARACFEFLPPGIRVWDESSHMTGNDRKWLEMTPKCQHIDSCCYNPHILIIHHKWIWITCTSKFGMSPDCFLFLSLPNNIEFNSVINKFFNFQNNLNFFTKFAIIDSKHCILTLTTHQTF